MSSVLEKWRTRKSDGVLRDSSRFFSYSLLIIVLTMMYRKYLAMQHSVQEFGFFTPLLALLMLLVRAFSVFPYICTKKMAILVAGHEPEAAAGFHKKLERPFFVSLGVLGAVFLALLPFMRSSGGFSTFVPLLAVFVIFVISMITAYYQSPFQAMQNFHVIGLQQLLNVVLKFVLTIMFFISFPGGMISPYTKTMLAQTLGAVIYLAVVLLYYRARVKTAVTHPEETFSFTKEVLPLFLILFMHAISMFADELVVKVALAPYEAGLYGAIVSIAKSMSFLVAPVVFVLLPKFSSDLHPRAGFRILTKGVLLLSAFGFLGTVLIMLLPDFLINLLTDAKYHNASGYLKYFFLACLPHNFFMLFVHYFIVRTQPLFVVFCAIGVVLHIGAFIVFHETLAQVIVVTGVSGFVYCLLAAAVLLRDYHRSCSGRGAMETR